MNCLHCNAPIDLSKLACSTCGVPLDADGDGIPDVLAKMIEDKARALLAGEEEREREAVEQAELKAAETAEVERRAENESSLASLLRERDRNVLEPRRVWYMNAELVVLFAFLAAIVGGIVFPACVEPSVGQSMVASQLFCPTVCPSCKGPGRIFTWHLNRISSSGNYKGNVSTQLCQNAQVDIGLLTWMEVSHREDKDLAPYRLTL